MEWKSCWPTQKGCRGLERSKLLVKKDGPDLAARMSNKIKLIKSPATKFISENAGWQRISVSRFKICTALYTLCTFFE